MSSAQTPTINLLGHEGENNSVINRIVNWAVTYGRYIMIATEIVVLLAFISRFSLDRKLTDLREEISQKKIILQSNQTFEEQFRITQKKLDATKSLLKKISKPDQSLSTIQSILPPDVYLTEFSVSERNIRLSAVAGTTTSFAKFSSLLSSHKEFKNVEVTNIKKNRLKGVEFQIQANLQ